jgi:hypothetical protein
MNATHSSENALVSSVAVSCVRMAVGVSWMRLACRLGSMSLRTLQCDDDQYIIYNE